MPSAAVPSFTNHLPVRVSFGDGVRHRLPALLDELGATRWVAVVDPAVAGLTEVIDCLAGAAEWLVVAPGEPTLESVEALGGQLAELAPQAVVAVGGGSTLDSAKGARLIAVHGGSIRRFVWPGEPEPIEPLTAIPLIALPTTAGTGSEVTGGIVMSDPARGIKVAAPSPHNRPWAALVDPELTHSLPPGPTLSGALDVLAQAIGAMTATTRTPVGDGLALEALRLIKDGLGDVVHAPDPAARHQVACASLLAGLAMNVSEAGSDHSLGHALGTVVGVPHGLSVAIMLPDVMEHERPAVADALERIADALGAPPGPAADGSRAVHRVRQMLDAVSCPTLRAVGVSEEDIRGLVEASLAAWIPVSPVVWRAEDVEHAFRRALDRDASTVVGS